MTAGDGQVGTRERLLDAAIRLFARQGYAETSIADIQRDCGLSAGSGALYKHFSSKRALLEAATRRFADRLANDRKRFEVNPGDGTEEVLRRAATLIWDGIEENSPLLRVIFREPAFPDLADELWSAITENAYRGFAGGLRVVVDAGMMRIDDPEATAAVLVASLAYYPMVRLLIGHTPGDIERDRYLEAWISHARAGFDYVR
ncbi:TetR/AcrR family transcriptional regulator [Mycolicibacterium moriokaense]|uniref:TetR family transcriptional regulator n=1 Tax=Mycolicibacterium moriokaense TaxID=39691 RepID=A0A318H3J6_9MYCO|nr:TetR/AcrR family transcriptional regulator [Mycolicibacterium moriokaense]PXW96282.1 TetR family transcriptional regulator [Mycolicibacterium moriokaense]